MSAEDYSNPSVREQAEPMPTVHRALLLEDDEVDCRAVLRALKRSPIPFKCDHARLLKEVDELVTTTRYDIVLTDMNLPDSSGLATITALIKLVGNTPIVVLSGNEDDSIALESVHAGAQDYIPKQYIGDASLINRTLYHAMERHQLKLGLESTRDRARFLAHYDQCTSLPNRLLFLDRINQAATQAQRNQSEFSVFFVDLDHFKHINDSIGHSAGDEVLRCVGERMKALVRECDTVARYGGDEFVLILRSSGNEEVMERLAHKLIKSINKPIPFGHHLCAVGASIGIAHYPRDSDTPEGLIKNADMAMYEAKKKGRNQVQGFTQELFEQQSQYFSIEKALREALHALDEHFTLHYQPRIELESGDIPAVEALIRWQHPKLGNIPPDQFIPLAEDLGLIDKIDRWVFEEACKKAQQWRADQFYTRISVNISGRSFNQRDLISGLIKPLLAQYGIDGQSLEIEITEGVLLLDTQQVLSHMIALKNLGVSLAIDDFGTGFSSLSYLNRFPIDTLKIDGSFICDQHGSRSEKALLKAIIALGSALEMKVVAECVETLSQQQYLLSLHCHEGQGYYWAKPSAQWEPQKSSPHLNDQ